MTEARAGRSLFWTIAVILLVTVVLGTALQWILADAVLRPLERREARSRSALEASRLAEEMSGPGAPTTEAEIESLLAHHRIDLGLRPSWVAFRTPGGTIVSDPPGRGRQIEAILAGADGRPSRDAAEAGPTAAPVIRHEFLARRVVTRDGALAGEVMILRPLRMGGPSGVFEALKPFLLLPIAVLATALVGLLLVRLLVRRLRSLEALATRVAGGDLSARVADRSGDEIGRVAEKLDEMIDRLAEARARIEANDHQRRQLFADITHELATPLTSIRGYAETLLNPDVATSPEERERFLRGIRAEAERLDRLTRDIFELARLEAAATRLQPEPLDWAALCRNTLERFAPRIQAAGLRASWRSPLEEAWVEADGHRLVQVIENLLTNAIRYVPSGGSIDLRLEPDGPGGYRLTVEDDGPGLPAESLPRLFERFYRAPRKDPGRANANVEGSGLGLAIVSAIVDQHGGSVEARARKPQGLSISMVLPGRVSGAPR